MTIDIDAEGRLRRARTFYRVMMMGCAFAFGANAVGFTWVGDIVLAILCVMFLVESVESSHRLEELGAIQQRQDEARARARARSDSPRTGR